MYKRQGQKAYEEVRKHRDTEKGSTVYENRLRMAERKMRSRMSMMNMFNIVDPATGKVVAQDILFMKTEKSGLQRPLKIRVDLATGETTEIPV